MVLLIGSLWAQGEFTEKRYIYALDKTTVFKGSITITDDATIIRYTSPEKKTLIQSGKTLTVEDVDANTSQVIDLSKQIDMSLYFSFMRSIYNQDFSGLKTYFEVTKEGDTYPPAEQRTEWAGPLRLPTCCPNRKRSAPSRRWKLRCARARCTR